MKKLTFSIILFVALLFSGCDIPGTFGFKNLTENVTDLLGNINSITALIDEKLSTGELDEVTAKWADDRLEKLSEVITEAMEKGGGQVFDRADGSIDNIFSNTQDLLEQIKKGILDGSLPNLIDQLSGQIEIQINLLSANVEDLIILTFQNSFVLIDKATNSIVTIASIVFLVIGLLIFGIILIRKKGKFKGFPAILGLIFMLIYILFFLGVLLIPTVRHQVIVGFDFGKEIEGVLNPKIMGITPKNVVIGQTKTTLYGNHLETIDWDSIRITLESGGSQKFNLPKENIIVISNRKIVLDVFQSNVPTGGFGLHVFNGSNLLKSPQEIDIQPVPVIPPDPDLKVRSISISPNTPIKGENSRLKIELGLEHAEQIKKRFRVKISSNPTSTSQTINIPEGEIAAAVTTKKITIYSQPFKFPAKGRYNFIVKVDENNKIKESNESNNSKNKSINVKEKKYIYTANVTYKTFYAKRSYDNGDDEYRFQISTTVPGYSPWNLRQKVDGTHGKTYIIGSVDFTKTPPTIRNPSKTYTNLEEGTAITVSISGYEEDAPDSDDRMGDKSLSFRLNIDKPPTIPINIETFGFKVGGEIKITRRTEVIN